MQPIKKKVPYKKESTIRSLNVENSGISKSMILSTNLKLVFTEFFLPVRYHDQVGDHRDE